MCIPKILILGSGQLGKYLHEHLKYENVLMSRQELDITDSKQIDAELFKYDYIVNCAAYTNVDKAEEDQESCFNVNYKAVDYIAKQCFRLGKKLVHISSETVYGSNDPDYSLLTESSLTTPTCVYSLSKLLGDVAIQAVPALDYCILRSGWLFGPNSDHNFITKIEKLLRSYDEIKVVNDQIGSLTYVGVICKAVENYIDGLIPTGVYNIANEGIASRHQVALFVREVTRANCAIAECASTDFKRAADVAKNSCLDCSKLKSCIDFEIPDWREDVRQMLEK